MTDLRERIALVIAEHRAVDNDRLFPSDYELADAALAEIGAGVKVKPLFWSTFQFEGIKFEAECPLGDYRIVSRSESWDVLLCRGDAGCEEIISIGKDSCAIWEIERQSKEAAQADYERRILSALEPAPVSVAEAARVFAADVVEMIDTMTATAMLIGLAGTSDWDKLAGTVDIYGIQDRARALAGKEGE